MGVKRAWAVLLGLALVVILAGCGIGITTSTNEDKQPGEQNKPGEFVYGPEVRIAELVAADAAALNEGDEPRQVALTQELREEFFDLGMLARWDFLPGFGYDGAAASEEISDYLYMIIASGLAWDGYWNIDHDNSRFEFSTGYVDEFIRAHFGLTVAHPQPGEEFDRDRLYKGLTFDGETYGSACSWREQPLYRLESLTVAEENIDGQERVVYEASLREYSYWPYDLPEGSSELADVIGESKELLCGEQEPAELPAGFSYRLEQQVRFYLDEWNQIRYLGCRYIQDFA